MFRREGPKGFVAQPPPENPGPTVWQIPPWKASSEKTKFRFSWDHTEAFFEDGAIRSKRIQPLYRLVGEMIAAGFGDKLRAGQSMYSLGLSRSLEHGLRKGQSHLFLGPQDDGRVLVEGLLGPETIEFGPVPALLKGHLLEFLDRLVSLPVD